MNSQLDGAGVHHADHQSAQHAAVPESIRWTQSAQERLAETRHDRIAGVAYFLSEARAFAPGHDEEDWLLALAQVDATDAGPGGV